MQVATRLWGNFLTLGIIILAVGCMTIRVVIGFAANKFCKIHRSFEPSLASPLIRVVIQTFI